MAMLQYNLPDILSYLLKIGYVKFIKHEQKQTNCSYLTPKTKTNIIFQNQYINLILYVKIYNLKKF